MLMDRVNRSRDQMDTLRAELLQERSSKQDLELDKAGMERHVRTSPQSVPFSPLKPHYVGSAVSILLQL